MAYQRQTWQVNESGILRKKDEPEEELLVFGYACKLFRDDEKALYVDQGKHLIPWMGNESLKIDRYDVRGAVYDLSQFETAGGQSEEPLWFNLSQEELKIEQMCDEERYRALTHNEDEEALYQEEELKRLHQALGSDKAYGQVSYKYDEEVEGGGDKNGEEDKGEESSNDKELDEPFKPPVELDLPQGMVIPESVKLNAIIEKTAMFIDRQGSQMEIVLKIKQSNNPQFQFLSLNSPLHPYYRFLLSAIKTGRYKPVIPASGGDGGSNEQENSQQNNSNSYYLHGSLAGTSSNVDVAPVIPTINYKPSADCAYSMLVNKIKGNQSKFLGAAAETVANSREESNSNSYDGVAASSEERVPVTRVQEELEEDSKGSMSPVTRPSRPPKRRRRKRQQGACAYYDPVEQEMENPVFEGPVMEEETVMYCEPPPPLQVSVPVPEVEVAVTVPPAPTLPVIDLPPADLQLIIDKMASYVAKNGRDFESIVRSKGDPRFHFLNPSNQFYEYYSRQVGHYESLLKPSASEVVPEEPQNSCEKVESFDDTSCDSLKKDVAVKSDGVQKKVGGVSKPLPVCFSIKKPKESEGLEIKSALPVEESSEGEEDEEREEGGEEKEVREEKVVVENVVRVTEVVVIPEVKILEEQVRGKGEKLLMIVEKKPVEKKIKVVEKEKLVQVGRDKEKMSGKEREKTKLVEKVKVLRKEKEKIAAKDKEKVVGKDKEKMVGKEKEKPVGKEQEKLVGKDKEKLDEKEREKQLERKRRAAAFLNLINKKQDTNSEPVIGPQLPPELAPNSNEMKSGENSVASTPPSSLSSPNHNPPLPPPPPQLNLAEVPTIEIEDSADEDKESLVKKAAKKKSSHRSCSIPSAKAYMEYYKASESKRLHSEYESLKRSRKSKKKSSRSSSDRKHSHRDLERSRSSSKRRRSSREESDHHSKHKHRRRRSKSREEGEVEEKRRKRKHKEKSYKSKKHKRKEEEEKDESEESSSSSSESSSSSSSDSD